MDYILIVIMSFGVLVMIIFTLGVLLFCVTGCFLDTYNHFMKNWVKAKELTEIRKAWRFYEKHKESTND